MTVSEKSGIIIQGLNIEYKESVACFVEILDQMQAGILIIDTSDTVLYINDKYTEITGVSFERIVGKKIRDVRPGGRLGEAMRSGKKILNLPRREGQQKYFVDLAPIVIDNQIVGGLTIMKNFADAQMMFEQLKQFKTKARDIESVIINQLSARFTFDDIIGESKKLLDAKRLARRVAASDSSVLLTGKTGTGKEMFAQSIHNTSPRKDRPFVPINCGAIPEALIESELFGYVRGAFTGAEKSGKIGLFELADGGTVFLDEIENMGTDLQIKLLRVLQERQIRKIGASDSIDVNVRVISATNVAVEKMVAQGRFREDLYYRICVFSIPIPDLVEREGDIPLLVNLFLRRHNEAHQRNIRITPEALEALARYHWPGNVRELQNIMEYLLNITEEEYITLEDFPAKIKWREEARSRMFLKDQLKVHEKNILQQYLLKYGVTVEAKKQIAAMLGISIATLYNKLREYGMTS